MLTNDIIIEKLEQLPNDIYLQEIKVVDLKEKVDMAELALSHRQAEIMLESDRPNATEKRQESISKTRELSEAVILLKKEEKLAEAKLTAYSNGFTALRKVVSLETANMQAKLTGN